MFRRSLHLLLPVITLVAGGALCVLGVKPAAATDTVVYAFCNAANCPDGELPSGDLVKAGGKLFGTTVLGGTNNNGNGTIFSVTLCGAVPCSEAVLHSFGSAANDGLHPFDTGLLRVKSRLYGATQMGGAVGYGTIFSIKTNGTGYTVLHSFCISPSCKDGRYPQGELIDVGGTLYGTTTEGGAYNAGTVFGIHTNGSGFQVLHTFGSVSQDGLGSGGGLSAVNNGSNWTLYGATGAGGHYGNGTVFSVTPCGAPPCPESVVYSFGANSADGSPGAGLIYKQVASVGYLYGTTENGGASGHGTVFAIDPNGIEKWLYSFAGSPADGEAPAARLLGIGAYLYGTTYAGGGYGGGTVFKIKANGLTNEATINSLGSGTDAANPFGGLINVGSKLYGTTYGGGSTSNCSGCGTVFSVP